VFGRGCERGSVRFLDLSVWLPQTTAFFPSEIAEVVEGERFTRRYARIVWLGYDTAAEQLAQVLQERDRRIDDRRLCVECAHAGYGFTCRKMQGFLIDVLRRCGHFEESS
jgi:hypothetical protein